MKPVQAVLLGIGILIIAWASLFITILNQNNQVKQILNNDHTLLSQDSVILNTQKKTESDLQKRIADLQTHIDCIVNLFQQPNRTNLVISDIENCQLTTSEGPATPSSTGAVAGQPSSGVSGKSSSQPQSAPNTRKTQAISSPTGSDTNHRPTPPSLLRKLLNLVGL